MWSRRSARWIEVQVREESTQHQTSRSASARRTSRAMAVRSRARSINEVAISSRARSGAGRPQREIARAVPASRRRSASWPRRRTSGAIPNFCSVARTIRRPWCGRNARLCGIGCHYMGQWMDARRSLHQMGGRAPTGWRGAILQAPHVVQNLGDGTTPLRLHGIRGASHPTSHHYKILFNDAVAMTADRPNDGGLTVPQIARQVSARVAKKRRGHRRAGNIPERAVAQGLTIHHRDDLMACRPSSRRSRAARC